MDDHGRLSLSQRESLAQRDDDQRSQPLRYSRRELIEMVFGAAALSGVMAGGVGCDQLDRMFSGALPPNGDLLSPNYQLGHCLRDAPAASAGEAPNADEPSESHRCVIVGAGVAGLAAARHLSQNGIDDFVVLELESVPGGTSRSGKWDGGRFPWGAHYLPVPMPDNKPLVEFLIECGVLEPTGDDSFVAAERYLCRDPEERVFADGQWHEGLFPFAVATQKDRDQLERFRAEVTRMAVQRGEDGRRWFAIPCGESSADASVRELDRISMAQWMHRNGFDSPLLIWLVDYACRDDYGLRADQTSAWAGLFYFSARVADEHGESQPVMTWPEGNGFLVDRLCEPLGDRLRLGKAVMRVSRVDPESRDSSLWLDVVDASSNIASTIHAEHVIVAVPQFIASRMLSSQLADERGAATNNAGLQSPLAEPPPAGSLSAGSATPETDRKVFSYGSWLVANVHLSDRPIDRSFPMSWDNVTLASGSLGYVNSTHQTGRDHGPTVLTWYQALPDDLPAERRMKLIQLTWAEAAETVLSDLELAHPDIRALVTRLDVMIWGHAMPQPRVGMLFHPARQTAAEAIGNVHFACTDLSGMALFEEAFAHGRRAASEVIDGELDA
ncbi:FAD-dependent oxidoreductase [Rhodopirellula sp. SWK7]|uniref:FAD-dependent oxidoreductase n=1 Tax=Rhodopirellula sp. SWK7 TaxID=595460 RepID=UPI0002BE6792|nr:FAD-dependent oxidoreductase [Rhodopirellula sp. SWK7]EMI40310.1 twin-arginine translocation pathway signal [Rhodopirellula sp. SWK7]